MTEYNGTEYCGCGAELSPAYASYSKECWDCKKDRNEKHLKKRMAP